jgi:hypothetical protein
MKTEKTERGFTIIHFKDSYKNDCSIQNSSSVIDSIWLGVDNPKLTVFEDESMGKYIVTDMPKTFSVYSRMHLTKETVAALLPILQKFVNTGRI